MEISSNTLAQTLTGIVRIFGIRIGTFDDPNIEYLQRWYTNDYGYIPEYAIIEAIKFGCHCDVLEACHVSDIYDKESRFRCLDLKYKTHTCPFDIKGMCRGRGCKNLHEGENSYPPYNLEHVYVNARRYKSIVNRARGSKRQCEILADENADLRRKIVRLDNELEEVRRKNNLLSKHCNYVNKRGGNLKKRVRFVTCNEPVAKRLCPNRI